MKNRNTKPPFLIFALILFFISVKAHSVDNLTILYYSNGDSAVYNNNIADTILFKTNGKLRQDVDKRILFYERDKILYAIVTREGKTEAYSAKINGVISVFSILGYSCFSHQKKPLMNYTTENLIPILVQNPYCYYLITDITSTKQLQLLGYGGVFLKCFETIYSLGAGEINNRSDVVKPLLSIFAFAIITEGFELRKKTKLKEAILEYNRNPKHSYKNSTD